MKKIITVVKKAITVFNLITYHELWALMYQECTSKGKQIVNLINA